MTNDDELLEWLDASHKICMRLSNGPHELFGQAAARIRELMPLLQFAKATSFGQREGVLNGTHVIVLASDWEFYKGFHDGVCKTKTHVVVPVEPTEAMAKAIHAAIDEAWDHPDVSVCLYRAMIKAAQEGGK